MAAPPCPSWRRRTRSAFATAAGAIKFDAVPVMADIAVARDRRSRSRPSGRHCAIGRSPRAADRSSGHPRRRSDCARAHRVSRGGAAPSCRASAELRRRSGASATTCAPLTAIRTAVSNLDQTSSRRAAAGSGVWPQASSICLVSSEILEIAQDRRGHGAQRADRAGRSSRPRRSRTPPVLGARRADRGARRRGRRDRSPAGGVRARAPLRERRSPRRTVEVRG